MFIPHLAPVQVHQHKAGLQCLAECAVSACGGPWVDLQLVLVVYSLHNKKPNTEQGVKVRLTVQRAKACSQH
jgi:hypothetical protein